MVSESGNLRAVCLSIVTTLLLALLMITADCVMEGKPSSQCLSLSHLPSDRPTQLVVCACETVKTVAFIATVSTKQMARLIFGLKRRQLARFYERVEQVTARISSTFRLSRPALTASSARGRSGTGYSSHHRRR